MSSPSSTALEQAILQSGYRKDWIARQIGVHKSQITRWCQDPRRCADPEMRKRLALVLRRHETELFPPDGVVAA